MRIWVTGVAGFIGHAVAARLLAAGHEVVGVDRLGPDGLAGARLTSLPGLDFVRGDLLAPATLDALQHRGPPDRVVHLAGRGGVLDPASSEADFQRDNVAALGAVLAATACPLVWASSSSVYGHASGPCAEDQALAPLSVYARSKLDAERLVAADGRPAFGLRLFTVYGPFGRPDMAVWRFARALREGAPITLRGVDTARDWTAVEDVVDAVLASVARVADRSGHHLVNVGAGRPVSLDTLLTALEDAAGRRAPRAFAPLSPVEARRTWADPARCAAMLGCTPRIRVEEGVARFWAWYVHSVPADEWGTDPLADGRVGGGRGC